MRLFESALPAVREVIVVHGNFLLIVGIDGARGVDFHVVLWEGGIGSVEGLRVMRDCMQDEEGMAYLTLPC